MDYREFFPDNVEVSVGERPSMVRVKFLWGDAVFEFGDSEVNVSFELRSIDFGYAEPFVEQVSVRIFELTGQPTDWRLVE